MSRDSSVENPDPFFGNTSGFNAEFFKFANRTPTTLQGSAFASGLALMVYDRREKIEEEERGQQEGKRRSKEENEQEEGSANKEKEEQNVEKTHAFFL